MFSKCLQWSLRVRIIVIVLCFQNTTGFFVKHVQTGMCINDTSIIITNGSWGNMSYLELSNNCLDPAAQFRFVNTGAMLNLKRPGCIHPLYTKINTKRLYLLPLWVASVSEKGNSCNQGLAVTQTSWGGLSVQYRSQTWCAVPKTDQSLANNQGIDPYFGLTQDCSDAKNKRFNFGSMTCHGNAVKNANCPKDKYMVVNTAFYRGLSDTKTCGLSGDYSCEVDVTCHVKKQCDGQHECNIAVDNNLFFGDPCPGLTKYLYFEYQCGAKMNFDSVCVDNVLLSNSSLPNEGVVQVVTNTSRMKSVCWQSLKNNTDDVICYQLGYASATSHSNKPVPSGSTVEIFPGSIDCNGGEKHLSQCSITTSNQTCSELSYIKCFICARPLLENKQRFPDSSFTASASSGGHSASDGRISSGSSWCAPVSDDKHYLQVDLGRLYVIDNVAIFGDSTNFKWVTRYILNYTVDLANWTSVSNQTISGNKNAYNDPAIQQFRDNITTKALRFIPLEHVGEPCMRIEICGGPLLPDQPTNLTIINVKSRSAKISWIDPVNTGNGVLTRFWIELKKDNSLILNITTDKVNNYTLVKLTPYTKYEISVAAGNKHGFGIATITSLNTSEEAPEGPPQNLKVTAESSSSLSVTWEPPEKDKRNGEIVNYTVCISHEENNPCFEELTTKSMTITIIVITNLNASTKYYVRVLASTKVGPGNYSESKEKITNGNQPEVVDANRTESQLPFSLQIPSRDFIYFYVVALKLQDENEKPSSSGSYENNQLVTYYEARKLSNPKPYIAAVIISSSVNGNTFVLGDGRNTSNSTSRKRRSTSSDYYNGPLEPAKSYSIFQRIFINKDDYYSTDWSAPSTTVQQQGPRPGDNGNGDDSNIPIIAGAAAGGCVLVIFVVVAIIMYRRRKDKEDSGSGFQQAKEVETESGPPVINEAFLNDPVAAEQNVNEGHDDKGVGGDNEVDGNEGFDGDNGVEVQEKTKTDPFPHDDTYGNQENIRARIHNPIPVEEFNDHVNHLRKNNNTEFKLDFEDLPSGRISNWGIAKKSFNIPKNRYGNAVTYNHTRVILFGDEKSDYINASFIDGLTQNYYIATQGPKPKTVQDLWRMIFEHTCPTIVMLTTLKEMGKVKCEKYWPDESGIYGDITVTTTETRTFADYVTRVFILKKGDEQHCAQQFHFMSWPDYGVPLYPTQILTFRRHFKSYHETKTGPAVIHCSAGVGRTGVFIAVDKILDDLDKGKKDTIDVFGFVKEMRTRRVNMVQTAEQYIFIHDAIVDHIKCGANEVEAIKVMTEIKNLSKKNGNGQTGFEEKFKRLNTVSPQLLKERCEAGLNEGNKKKNRKPEIYPSESSRPYLRHIENVENSDYINACHVDGYLGKNYFIATQTPLMETINDFWRMVLQHNSSTIVMLNQVREGNEEYPTFWPTERAKPQSFGATTVMFDSFHKNDNIVTRKFIVSPSADMKEGRMVRMIQYMCWPDHGVPENVDDVVKVLSEVEDSQRAAEKKGPVVVVCSDGAGRSGTYITISNLVDRVKVVQVIDVFQCIKLIRTRRPQFVETAAQFKLCYDAVASVLRSFKEYSNFTDLKK